MSLALARDRAHEPRLTFGPFIVDTARRAVLKNGSPLHLTLKCVELLIALVRNAGRTLSKEELIDSAWHDPSASDATLAQHIFLLRRALEQHAVRIQTVPQVGYRFNGPVAPHRDDAGETLQAYIRGARIFQSLMTEQGLHSAIDLYGRVIELHDGDASAYAGRATCRRLLAQCMYADPLPSLAAAKRDARAALQRDGACADALVEAAYAAALYDRDLGLAASLVRDAASLQPDHPDALTLPVSLRLMQGDVAGAFTALRRRSGPLYGAVLYAARDFAAAERELSKRSDDPLARLLAAGCRLFQGDVASARREFDAIYHEEVDVRQASQPNVRHYALAFLIYTDARSGDPAAAQRGVVDLARLGRERYVSPMARAIAHAGLREYDSAVSFIEEAVLRLDPWAVHIAVDPLLDDLRADPRFVATIGAIAGSRVA